MYITWHIPISASLKTLYDLRASNGNPSGFLAVSLLESSRPWHIEFPNIPWHMIWNGKDDDMENHGKY